MKLMLPVAVLLMLGAADLTKSNPSDWTIRVQITPQSGNTFARRPLDPKIIPLTCTATVLDAKTKAVYGSATVEVIAGRKESTYDRSRDGRDRIDLTCHISPEGDRAKTEVVVTHDGTTIAHQLNDVWLPRAFR